MAGPLANARHERFAQELAKGASQVDAYSKAGFKPNASHACRLGAKVEIVARVAELKHAAATATIITVQDIANQLDEDRAFAKSINQASPMVSATMGKAKVLGLIVDKAEHTGKDGGPIQVEDISDEDAAKRMLFVLARARADRDTAIN